jgi:glycosyltransferase involved in cell wall biosynthesis
MMKVSVILCTHNRCDVLRQALESLAASRFEEMLEWEILIVDNNSHDNTANLAQEFVGRYPEHFRYVFEPAAGKSFALNRGVREAQGEILAFTDDDVLVEPEWLDKLTRPLCSGPYAGASGKTLPPRDFVPPTWLPLHEYFALAPLALFDRGMQPVDLHEAPFGNNMAFRRELFDRYGDFRVDIGRRPGSILGSEDSEFGDRLLNGGERFCYEPSAVLYHAVPPERVTQTYFLSWWHDKTRSDVRAYGLDCSRKSRVRGIPLPLFGRLLRWTLQWCLTLDPARRFACKVRVWIVRGAMRECYGRAHAGEHAATHVVAEL